MGDRVDRTTITTLDPADSRPAAWRPPSESEHEEAVLVAALRNRNDDDAALSRLIRQHQAPMLRLAMFYLPDRCAAEEVVQETWLAVLRGVDRFGGRSSVKTWIYSILVNRAKSAGARERRSIPLSAVAQREFDPSEPGGSADRFVNGSHAQRAFHWHAAPAPWEQALEDGVVVSEAVGVVRDAINALPPVQRLVVTLRDVECWTAQEVCDVLDLAQTNQRVLLHRGRSKVRGRLERYYA